MMTRFCGDCAHLDDERQICLLNLAYSAFVYPWMEANDCEGYLDRERAAAEQAQHGIYDAPAPPKPTVPFWGNYISGVKP